MASMTAVELAPWVERIKARRSLVKQEIAPREVNLLMLASQVRSAPRRLRKALAGVKQNYSDMQLPWIPAFAGLESRPFHDTSRFAWARALEDSVGEIRDDLHQVQRDFGRAAYDSDRNVKVWNTFYFYLNSRPVNDHLDACPLTKEPLSRLRINGL